MINRVSTPWLSVVLVALLALPAAAHPFHMSTAELEVNAKTGRIEVGLKIHATDLELALSKMAGKRIQLDGSEASDQWLAKYLSQHFYLTAALSRQAGKDKPAPSQTAPSQTVSKQPTSSQTDSAGTSAPGTNAPGTDAADKVATEKRSSLTLAGTESEKNWLWIYFELDVPEEILADSKTCRLVNSLLIGETDSQINTMQIRSKLGRQALRTNQRQQVVELKCEWLLKSNAASGPSAG